jgi:hypothetical protein
MRNKVIDWWRRRRWTAPRVDQLRWYESQSDLPLDLARHELAAVGSADKPKWFVFECPCGTGHRLQINASPRHRPHWKLVGEGGQPSLKPSVDFDEPSRRCHFWLRNGRVRWAGNSYISRGTPRRRR